MPLKSLNASGIKSKITDIGIIGKSLTRLNASMNPFITDKAIADMPLTVLSINGKIYKITGKALHKMSLKWLKASRNTQIYDDDLKNQNRLKYLDVSGNPNFTGKYLKHMPLKTLIIHYSKTGVIGNNLIGLDLEILGAADNPHITDKSILEMKNLRTLHVDGKLCKVTDNGIKDKKLTILNVRFNSKITDEGITGMSLRILDATDNHRITNRGIYGMPLKRLYAGGNCGITDIGVADLNLDYLLCRNNPKITIDGSFVRR